MNRTTVFRLAGLAGLAGVAATTALVARDERRRRDLEPEQIREQLHARFAAASSDELGSDPQDGR